MFGMLILRAFVIVLVGVIIVLIRSYFKKVQIHNRVMNQIKQENEIWNEVLKRKVINKV